MAAHLGPQPLVFKDDVSSSNTSPQRDNLTSPSWPDSDSGAFPKHCYHCLDAQIIERSTYAVDGGGYSDIWTGSYRDQMVAIKILRPFSSRGKRIEKAKLRKRLWREYLASSRHSHPNVLKCIGYSYDFNAGSDYEVPSLISPWMQNGTINAYIRECPDIDRLKLVIGIAEGLSYLHAQQPATVHGDLRAGNILVSDAGVPCLTDFGLSRILGDGVGITTSSQIGGSSRWMSPELIQYGKADKSSDVWAYAMTVLEIMSGERPYHEISSEPMVLLQIIGGQLPARPLYDGVCADLTDDLWALCLKCWAFRTIDRPSTRQILLELTPSSESPSSPTRCNDVHSFEFERIPLPHEYDTSPAEDDNTVKPKATFKWGQYVDELQYVDEPTHSPGSDSGRTPTTSSTTRIPAAKPGPSDSNDGLKSLKVSPDDPAWKVLPAALKKYKINRDDWHNYAMFICYGSTERYLRYDEKPLLLFQKLKVAKKKPIFMLKHIRDIRSPSAVAAQQMQTARQMAKADEEVSTPVLSPSSPQSPVGRPASSKFNANDDSGDREHSPLAFSLGQEVIYPKDVSYAAAICPYVAEQEDELHVAVGDSFIILQQARGRWEVQCNPTGSTIVENNPSKRGWVPGGCLLETSVPVASAMAGATGSGANSTENTIRALPLSTISKSFPAIAQMDYERKGEDELDLKKDDMLRVFKRSYNHWSYAMKEDGEARGWVPSWLIDEVACSSTPQILGTNGPIHASTMRDLHRASTRRHGVLGFA